MARSLRKRNKSTPGKKRISKQRLSRKKYSSLRKSRKRKKSVKKQRRKYRKRTPKKTKKILSGGSFSEDNWKKSRTDFMKAFGQLDDLRKDAAEAEPNAQDWESGDVIKKFMDLELEDKKRSVQTMRDVVNEYVPAVEGMKTQLDNIADNGPLDFTDDDGTQKRIDPGNVKKLITVFGDGGMGVSQPELINTIDKLLRLVDEEEQGGQVPDHMLEQKHSDQRETYNYLLHFFKKFENPGGSPSVTQWYEILKVEGPQGPPQGDNPRQSFDEAFESWVNKLAQSDLVELSKLFYIEDELDDDQSELDNRRKFLLDIYKELEQGIQEIINPLVLPKPGLEGAQLTEAIETGNFQLDQAKVDEAKAKATQAEEQLEEESASFNRKVKENAGVGNKFIILETGEEDILPKMKITKDGNRDFELDVIKVDDGSALAGPMKKMTVFLEDGLTAKDVAVIQAGEDLTFTEVPRDEAAEAAEEKARKKAEAARKKREAADAKTRQKREAAEAKAGAKAEAKAAKKAEKAAKAAAKEAKLAEVKKLSEELAQAREGLKSAQEDLEKAAGDQKEALKKAEDEAKAKVDRLEEQLEQTSAEAEQLEQQLEQLEQQLKKAEDDKKAKEVQEAREAEEKEKKGERLKEICKSFNEFIALRLSRMVVDVGYPKEQLKETINDMYDILLKGHDVQKFLKELGKNYDPEIWIQGAARGVGIESWAKLYEYDGGAQLSGDEKPREPWVEFEVINEKIFNEGQPPKKSIVEYLTRKIMGGTTTLISGNNFILTCAGAFGVGDE